LKDKSHLEPLPIRTILIKSQNLQVTHKIVKRTGFVESVEETKKDLWITVNTQGIREKYNIESFLYAWSF